MVRTLPLKTRSSHLMLWAHLVIYELVANVFLQWRIVIGLPLLLLCINHCTANPLPSARSFCPANHLYDARSGRHTPMRPSPSSANSSRHQCLTSSHYARSIFRLGIRQIAAHVFSNMSLIPHVKNGPETFQSGHAFDVRLPPASLFLWLWRYAVLRDRT